jgi:hypothetical protein
MRFGVTMAERAQIADMAKLVRGSSYLRVRTAD